MDDRMTAALPTGCNRTRETNLEQRAALCWLLRDGRYHRADHLEERFSRCVWSGEGVPAPDLRAPVDLWLFAVASALGSPKRVFLSTRDWLVEHGACEIRIRRGKEWVRLARPSKQLSQRMARTVAFEDAAMTLARSRLGASERPSVEQMWRELMDLDRPRPDPRGRVLVADEVIAWYAREASLPDVASEDFWLRAGFFSERSLWYFRDLAEGATRLIGKALLFEVLSGRAKAPPAEVFADVSEAAGWAHSTVHTGMSGSMPASLNDALWALLCPQDEWPVAKPKVVLAVAEADWSAIGRRLSEELNRHHHRRGLRALELACAMPYEHVEARLGGFVGTPEENFLRVTYGRAA